MDREVSLSGPDPGILSDSATGTYGHPLPNRPWVVYLRNGDWEGTYVHQPTTTRNRYSSTLYYG